MKYLFIILSIALFGIPSLASAHIGDTGAGQEPRTLMMRQIEDASLGDELHTEMEQLMEGLIDGELTKEGVSRMTELMNQYPGAGSMMMNRMMGISGTGFGSLDEKSIGVGMMGYGFGGGLFMVLLWILIIISIIALIKYIRGNVPPTH